MACTNPLRQRDGLHFPVAEGRRPRAALSRNLRCRPSPAGSAESGRPDTPRASPGRSYIGGETPTGEEFAALLEKAIHKVKEREMTYRYVMRKVGNRKVHVPLMGMLTAGDGHMVITRNEIFDDDEPLQPWLKSTLP